MRFTLAVMMLASVSQAQQSNSTGDSGVRRAIQKAFPHAKIVATADIDGRECGSVPARPGFVSADFDGDGRADFAVLLKDGETGKDVAWEGKRLRETRYVFAIFLATRSGSYEPVRITRFLQHWPVLTYIEFQPAAVLRGLGDERRGATVALKNPAVSLISCGKSSVVFYVSGRKVGEFLTSD